MTSLPKPLADAVRRCELGLQMPFKDDSEGLDRVVIDAADLRLLLNALRAEGWRLVPVEPIEAMIEAGWKVGVEDGDGSILSIWSAMLAASPLPPPPAKEA